MRTVLNSQIKDGPGAISSSRCQTTRAQPGKPGRARIFSFVDERNGLLRARRSSSSHALTQRSPRRQSFAPEPEQKRMPTPKLRNRRHHACQTTKPARAAERRTITRRIVPPVWWSQTGSNRRPPACKAGALPTELWPRRMTEDGKRMTDTKRSCPLSSVFRHLTMVGLGRLELPTSRLSSARSNQLSYKPAPEFRSQSSAIRT